MSPVSKTAVPSTWVRRLSQAADHRYNSDGNSSSYSSAEENQRHDRQYLPPIIINDDLSARSYVDPWDMENYSFLRKQLEDFNLSDNETSPLYDPTPNDFYYVPLDNDGSPQYQYKRYVDITPKGGISPQSLRSDGYGLVANIDEYDFYNEHLDTNLSMLHVEDPSMEFSNPSRQSERSRYNNQDYHTYTPPSIIKDISNGCTSGSHCKLRRRASVSFCPDTYTYNYIENDTPPSCHFATTTIRPKDKFFKLEERKSLTDVKIKLNRRKSFHDVTNNPDIKFGRLERRKSMLGSPLVEKWKPSTTEIIPEHQIPEKVEKRKSLTEIPTETPKKPHKNLEKGILLTPENKCNRIGLNVSFNNEVLHASDSLSRSSLVYVYETPGRKRKMFLPNICPNFFGKDNLRYNQPDFSDAFTFDPLEQSLSRPCGRYTMTNYGHLKIDYSCSWNYLDKVITRRNGI